jgi:membrane protein implicated in regulation of membrane protease activity
MIFCCIFARKNQLMTIMIEYFVQHLWQVWAVVAVLCLIMELMAGDFFIICFAFGAMAAAVVAALGLNGYIQLLAFAVFTLVFLFWFRPLARRYLHKGEDNRVSNADALLGRQGRVVETVKAGGYGRVQIDGDIWKAVTLGENDIPEGTTVTVTDRASTIITVE